MMEMDPIEKKAIEDIKIDLGNLNEEDFIFRFIEENDYYKEYFELLTQLTVSPTPRFDDWQKILVKLKYNNTYLIVIEYLPKKIIVGSITCLIENKFIRNLGKVCHIEDVVVHSDYRNKRFGSKLGKLAIKFSELIGCYKIILDSRDDASQFYQKLGFEKKSDGMALYLKP